MNLIKNAMVRVLTILALSAAFSLQAAIPEWKLQAIEQLNKGQFNNVETILRQIPPQDVKKNSVAVDSIHAIMDRIRYDFRMTPEEGKEEINKKVLNVTDDIIAEWKEKKYIETMSIDGKEMWFRKAVRNLWLLDNEDFALQNKLKRKQWYSELYNYYISSMSASANFDGVRNWHSAQITFTLDVDADAVPVGEMVKVWLPFPFENKRQRNIKFITSSHKTKMSKGSGHHTVYMEAKAEAGKPIHFELTFSYDVGAQVFSYNDVMTNLEPYKVKSKEYKKYTRSEYPHIIIDDEMKEIAQSIVGDETNPLKQSSMVYNWIVSKYPWAGARDYSTIPNIPKYVISEKHGDCGQVSLLNITLLRALGIPARWESGWMLHPNNVGMHDWGEIYFEGTGWVPCDVSFGRTVAGEVIQDYYKMGIDVYRLATNTLVCGKLSPEKKYIRAETVDFQAGEVEWNGGNVPIGKWHSNINVDKFDKIEKD